MERSGHAVRWHTQGRSKPYGHRQTVGPFWIPAFAGMTEGMAGQGQVPCREISPPIHRPALILYACLVHCARSKTSIGEECAHARTDDGRPIDHYTDDRTRGALPWLDRNRIAHRRRTDPPLHLRGRLPANQAIRQRPQHVRRGARRPGRDLRMERLPASGALFRHLGRRRRVPCDQPAPVSRAAGLHHQPCGRPVRLSST